MAKLKITEDSPNGLKLAFIFWNGLGRPKAFAKASVLEAWAPRLEKLTRRVSMPYSQFKWFLIWCTRLRDEDGANYGNAFTAENLRVAKNPMGSLEKQFAVTFHEIFIPRADKLVSLLQDRVQREMDDRSRTKPPIAVTWYDVLVDKDNPQPRQVEKARHMTALDERFPMLHPAPAKTWTISWTGCSLPFRPTVTGDAGSASTGWGRTETSTRGSSGAPIATMKSAWTLRMTWNCCWKFRLSVALGSGENGY